MIGVRVEMEIVVLDVGEVEFVDEYESVLDVDVVVGGAVDD